MKKNKMMRLASALLILVLLTTSIIGGTFAKYATTDSSQDTARVAKWGVVIEVSSDLFKSEYTGDTTGYEAKATVKTSDADTKLVAPGTTGKGLEITNTATSEPEVSYEMRIKLDNTPKMPSLKYTPTGGTQATYEPVKFNVYNDTDKLNNAAPLTFEQLKDLFDGTKGIYKYDVNTGEYTVDTDLDGDLTDETGTTAIRPDIKVEWVWTYEDATDKALYDELDTILGDTAAVAAGATAISAYSAGSISDINTAVSLNWTVTATQID